MNKRNLDALVVIYVNSQHEYIVQNIKKSLLYLTYKPIYLEYINKMDPYTKGGG